MDTHSTSPASFGQEQFWLLEQAAEGTAVNHTVQAWELVGPLRADVLQASLDLLVTRHEVLRTTLHPVDGELVQRVEPPRPVPVVEVDLAGDSGRDECPAAVSVALRAPFDLSNDLPLRAVLGRWSDDRHFLALVVHHVACDGWSANVLRSELAASYTALSEGRLPDLRLPGTTYAAFARREREWWETAGKAVSEPWLRALRAEDRRYTTPFPTGRARSVVSPAGIARVEVPEHSARRFAEVAEAAGTTRAMVLVALFGLLMSRWTGERAVRFSSPVGNRLTPDVEHTVGFFVSSLPFSLNLRSDLRFADLLVQARTAVLTGIEHVRVPPEELRSAMAEAAGNGANPLLDVTLAVQTTGPSEFPMGDLVATSRFAHPGQTMFGLSVRADLGDDRCTVYFEYDSDLLDAQVVARMGEHLVELAAAVALERKVVDFPPAPADDLALIHRWSRGPVGGRTTGVLVAVANHATDRPDAIAVRDGEETLTYARLWERSGRVAAHLARRGAGVEDVVAVCLPRSAEFVVVVLGILRAGAAFLPLDPRDPVARRVGLLTRSGAKVLVVADPARAEGWAGAAVMTTGLLDRADAAASGPVEPPAAPRPDAIAYVIHTSGSTGTPKGVMITHRGLENYLSWAVSAYGLEPGAEVPLHTSTAFDLAITSLLGPLVAGAAVHVLPEDRSPLVVTEHLVRRYRMVKGTPSHMAGVLASAVDFPDVLVLGGESLPADHVREWRAAAPGIRIVNEYGPTETVVGSTAHVVDAEPEGTGVPVGTPIDGTVVHVVDDELRPVPIGVRGELVIGGLGVARGYRNAPGVTADRFVPDPEGGGERLYRTGDLARWTTDGVLEVVGRIDDQVKVLGYRVEPGEVEAALAAAPGVRHAAVVVDRSDEGQARLVGFVQAMDPATAGQLGRRVREHLGDRLPAHLVPGRIVVLDRLPLDPNGKVDRRALVPPADTDAVPDRPADRTQDLVRAVWSEVLGTEELPSGADFFAAGGTSLHLLRMEAAFRRRGVTSLTVADLFRFPTIDEQADRIGRTGAFTA